MNWKSEASKKGFRQALTFTQSLLVLSTPPTVEGDTMGERQPNLLGGARMELYALKEPVDFFIGGPIMSAHALGYCSMNWENTAQGTYPLVCVIAPVDSPAFLYVW